MGEIDKFKKLDGRSRVRSGAKVLPSRVQRPLSPEKREELRDRDKAFVEAYAANGFMNAGPSLAEVSGLKVESATVTAAQLLKKPEVRRYKEKIQGEIMERSLLSAEFVIGGFMDVAENSENDGARVQALDRLARIVGLFDSDLNPFLQDKRDLRVGGALEAYDDATLREVEAVLASAPKVERVN
jgi:hypothetical protein